MYTRTDCQIVTPFYMLYVLSCLFHGSQREPHESQRIVYQTLYLLHTFQDGIVANAKKWNLNNCSHLKFTFSVD